MDFGTIRKKLETGAYSNLEQLELIERETEAYHWIYSKNAKDSSNHDNATIVQFSKTYGVRNEFYCMRGRKWVSNRMVSIWVAYLNDKQKKGDSGLKHYFFYSYFADELKKSQKDFYTENCSKCFPKNIQQYKRLFISVLHENYWFLYVMELAEKRFYALDSLDLPVGRISGQTFIGNMITNMCSCLKRLRLEGLPEQLCFWDCYSAVRLPKQKNLFDCGVFVMKYMECWDGKKLTPSFTQRTWKYELHE